MKKLMQLFSFNLLVLGFLASCNGVHTLNHGGGSGDEGGGNNNTSNNADLFSKTFTLAADVFQDVKEEKRLKDQGITTVREGEKKYWQRGSQKVPVKTDSVGNETGTFHKTLPGFSYDYHTSETVHKSSPEREKYRKNNERKDYLHEGLYGHQRPVQKRKLRNNKTEKYVVTPAASPWGDTDEIPIDSSNQHQVVNRTVGEARKLDRDADRRQAKHGNRVVKTIGKTVVKGAIKKAVLGQVMDKAVFPEVSAEFKEVIELGKGARKVYKKTKQAKGAFRLLTETGYDPKKDPKSPNYDSNYKENQGS